MDTINKIKSKSIIFTACIIFILSGCSDNSAGIEIPADAQFIKISHAEKNIEQLKDKHILLAGNFSGFCGGGKCCKDFFLNEGINSIKIYANNLKVPNFKKGQPMKVYGILKTTKTSPYIQALGLEAVE